MRRAFLSLLVVVAALAWTSTPAGGEVTGIAASAFGVLAIENADQTIFGPQPTVTLPPNGTGRFIQTVMNVSSAQLGLEAGELRVEVEGSGLGGHEGAAAANTEGESFDLENIVFADFVTQCSADVNGAMGGTTFLDGDVIVNGSPQQLPQNPAPNTVIDASSTVRVILNEQARVHQAGQASISVAALHVTVLDGADETDIFVGQLECGVTGPDVLAAPGAAPPGGEPALPLADPSDPLALQPPAPLRVTPTFAG